VGRGATDVVTGVGHGDAIRGAGDDDTEGVSDGVGHGNNATEGVSDGVGHGDDATEGVSDGVGHGEADDGTSGGGVSMAERNGDGQGDPFDERLVSHIMSAVTAPAMSSARMMTAPIFRDCFNVAQGFFN